MQSNGVLWVRASCGPSEVPIDYCGLGNSCLSLGLYIAYKLWGLPTIPFPKGSKSSRTYCRLDCSQSVTCTLNNSDWATDKDKSWLWNECNIFKVLSLIPYAVHCLGTIIIGRFCGRRLESGSKNGGLFAENGNLSSVRTVTTGLWKSLVWEESPSQSSWPDVLEHLVQKVQGSLLLFRHGS